MQRATEQSKVMAMRILVVMFYVLGRAATIVIWMSSGTARW
jgi:hypothetical protein